jgi:hypothetical protein
MARLQPFATLPQQRDRIRDMFNDMSKNNDVIQRGLVEIRYGSKARIKALTSGAGNCRRIKIDSRNIPAKRTHARKEFTVSTTNVE